MKVTLDNAGRMVLPKSIRDEYHLGPGSVLEVRQGEDCIVLQSVSEQALVKSKEGLLVISTSGPVEYDQTIRALRDERLDYLGGMKE